MAVVAHLADLDEGDAGLYQLEGGVAATAEFAIAIPGARLVPLVVYVEHLAGPHETDRPQLGFAVGGKRSRVTFLGVLRFHELQ